MDRIFTGDTRCTRIGGIMFSELLQSSALTQALVRYLTRDRSLAELEEFLVGNMQDFLDSREPKTINMANEVDALIIEKEEGLLSEDQLRETLHKLLLENEGLIQEYLSASDNVFISTEEVIFAPNVHLQAKHSFGQVMVSK
jgi:hypothetical protein